MVVKPTRSANRTVTSALPEPLHVAHRVAVAQHLLDDRRCVVALQSRAGVVFADALDRDGGEVGDRDEEVRVPLVEAAHPDGRIDLHEADDAIIGPQRHADRRPDPGAPDRVRGAEAFVLHGVVRHDGDALVHRALDDRLRHQARALGTVLDAVANARQLTYQLSRRLAEQDDAAVNRERLERHIQGPLENPGDRVEGNQIARQPNQGAEIRVCVRRVEDSAFLFRLGSEPQLGHRGFDRADDGGIARRSDRNGCRIHGAVPRFNLSAVPGGSSSTLSHKHSADHPPQATHLVQDATGMPATARRQAPAIRAFSYFLCAPARKDLSQKWERSEPGGVAQIGLSRPASPMRSLVIAARRLVA